MEKNSRVRILSILLVIAIIAGVGAPLVSEYAFTTPAVVNSTTGYKLTEIAPIQGYEETSALDINDAGSVLVSMIAPGVDPDMGDPFLLKNGHYFAYTAPNVNPGEGRIHAYHLNSLGATFGEIHEPPGFTLRHAYWLRPGPPVLLPPVNYGQYYLEGQNDYGTIVGYMPVGLGYDGVLINTASGEISTDPDYTFRDINNLRSVLRQDSQRNIEILQAAGASPILPPNLHGLWLDDLRLNNADTVYGRASDEDPSDNIIGEGADCAVWRAPDFTPELILPPGRVQTDWCEIVSMNSSGMMLIDRMREVGGQNQRSVFQSDGQTFREMQELVPGLLNYEHLRLSKINSKGQIALTARRDGVYRGIILTPLRTGNDGPRPAALPQ